MAAERVWFNSLYHCESFLNAAREWLADHGYDPQMGARPMARLVEQKVKKPLSQAMVFGGLSEGGTALVEVQDDDLILTYIDAKNPTVEA